MKQIFHTDKQLKLALSAISTLIACLVIYIQHGWINDDTVLYLEAARLFSIGDWQAATHLFPWPLYSLLIASLHWLTVLNFQLCAQILNVIFFAISTYYFLHIITLAGGNRTTLICGALLLFSSPYIVGDVLPMLLRDQGFWAMFLASLVYFIKFYRDKKLSNALLWQTCAIFAVFFRIEAITFLIILPLLLFKQPEFTLKQRITHFFSINIIPVFALFVVIGALLILPSLHLSDFGRLQEVATTFPRILAETSQNFHSKTSTMGENILGISFNDYGLLGSIIAFGSIIVFKVVNLIGWPVVAIFALSYASRLDASTQLMLQDTRRILYWTCALSLLNACVIIASVFILSSRYIVALGFIVLIFAAFYLAALVEKIHSKQINTRWQRILFFIILALIALTAIKNVLPKRAGYNFEQDAVAYLKQQHIPNEKVFFVSPRSRYFAGAAYAGRGYEYWDYTQKAIADGSIYQYDYLAINLEIDDEFSARKKILDENLPQYKITKEFYGYKNKKKMMLYEKK